VGIVVLADHRAGKVAGALQIDGLAIHGAIIDRETEAGKKQQKKQGPKHRTSLPQVYP
jgi:hypothetical protein